MPTVSPLPAHPLTLLQHPRWLAFDWLVHGFSTRQGGCSTVYANSIYPYNEGELNLGFTPADSRENVLANRELLLRTFLNGRDHVPAARLVTLSQIHSAMVHSVPELATDPPPGDGLISAVPGALLAIQTADCVPVLLVDTKQRIVAAFHAGWRGTVKRIVESGVGRMRAEFNSHPRDLTALIGPAIGSCCYIVGDELHQEFTTHFTYAPELFKSSLKADAGAPSDLFKSSAGTIAGAPGLASETWESAEGAHLSQQSTLHLDLIEANRRQLLDAGLDASSIHVVGGCTSCHPDLYFSHRQSGGHTGRMMSVVGILEE